MAANSGDVAPNLSGGDWRSLVPCWAVMAAVPRRGAVGGVKNDPVGSDLFKYRLDALQEHPDGCLFPVARNHDGNIRRFQLDSSSAADPGSTVARTSAADRLASKSIPVNVQERLAP